jgi:hypothetical protein
VRLAAGEPAGSATATTTQARVITNRGSESARGTPPLQASTTSSVVKPPGLVRFEQGKVLAAGDSHPAGHGDYGQAHQQGAHLGVLQGVRESRGDPRQGDHHGHRRQDRHREERDLSRFAGDHIQHEEDRDRPKAGTVHMTIAEM